jgi:TolB-like protein
MVHADQQGVGVDPTTALPTDAEILAQLDRIRFSTEFDAPERARRFLAYVIEETIAGRAERIKAYAIATEVFGRDASFDAQTDPAVRIEAGRVRRALERYYLVAGRNDPIVIKMPKGAYVPTFERRVDVPTESGHGLFAGTRANAPVENSRQPWAWVAIAAFAFALGGLAANALLRSIAPENSADMTGFRPNIPKLAVMPFEDLSGTPHSAMITRGLTDEVVNNIARFKEIIVVTGEKPDDSLRQTDGPAYALEGRVRLDGEKLRLGIRLVQRSDGSVVWANNYDESLATHKIIELQEKAAAAVATAVAQPYGVVFQANATQFTRFWPITAIAAI